MVITILWTVDDHKPYLAGSRRLDQQIQPIVRFVCFWFGHANSAVNPWLYIFLSTKINMAFIRIVSRKSSRLPSSLTVKKSDAVLPPEDDYEAIQKESRV